MKDIKTAEEYLSENYNGFYDEFDIPELQDIVQAMNEYAEYYHKAKVYRDNRMLNYVLDTFRQIKNIYRKGKEETALDRSINQSEEFLNKLLNDL